MYFWWTVLVHKTKHCNTTSSHAPHLTCKIHMFIIPSDYGMSKPSHLKIEYLCERPDTPLCATLCHIQKLERESISNGNQDR